MTSRLISIVNQKGGCGKTSVTMQLAGGLAAHGLSVLVVDADESNNAMVWASLAPDDAPFPATVVNLAGAGGKVAQEVRKHIAHYDVILCDGPPSASSPVTQSLAVLADLVIIPVQPTGNDDNSLAAMLRVVEQAQTVNPNLQVRLLFNRVQPQTRLHRALMDRMGSRGVAPFEASFGNRVTYSECMVAGTTVLGFGDEAAEGEVLSLTAEVMSLMHLHPVEA